MSSSIDNNNSEKVKSIHGDDEQRYRVLVEFAYKHLDFQMAELESTLDMYGMQLDGPDCKIEKLPGDVGDGDDDDGDGDNNDNKKDDNKGNDNDDEHTNATNTTNTKEDENDDNNNNDDDDEPSSPPKKQEITKPRRPFVILSFPSSMADRLSANPEEKAVDKWKHDGGNKNNNNNNINNNNNNNNIVRSNASIGEIILRCTLVKSVVELWGAATTLESCAVSTNEWKETSLMGTTLFQRESVQEKSWKMTVHTLGAKYTREEQDVMRKKFSYLGFQGPVQLKEPDNEFIVIREVEMDGKGSPLHGLETAPGEATAAPPALAFYFGRILGAPGTREKGRRGGLEQYNLKHRAYLGPTSMDAELSFVMTNLGQVHKSSIVYDPFVGTGSILLSCALRGAYCIGSDIDIRVLKGRSQKENIWTNFDQFNLRRPDITRTDNAIYHRHFRCHKPLYDAIVCDPPYGIRAGARKTGSRRLEEPRAVLDEHRGDHIAQTKPYPVCDVMSDLLDVAARTLCLGGRLVYVIPSFADFDEATDLPRHDCLELVHSCYQPLSVELGRRIVAMKKVIDYDPSKREKYLETVWVNGRESAEKCANLRDKILEHAKQKPGYEEKAAIRRQKRKATKEAKKKKKAKAAKQSETP